MPRARWWVVGALSLVTASVVVLDLTGVIFQGSEAPDPPQPLVLPAVADADPTLSSPVIPEKSAAQRPDLAAIRRVERILGREDLGRSVHAQVVPLADPSLTWLQLQPDAPVTPASTLKLWTAIATLDASPQQHTLVTAVKWDESRGTLVLVGAGDATIETRPARRSGVASLTDLARQTAKSLKRSDAASGRISLNYDTSLFSGPAVSPAWEPTYVSSGVIAPVTALMVDQGAVSPPALARYADPALGATQRFAELLEQRGVSIRSEHRSVKVDNQTSGADEIGSVESPPMIDLVERMLRDSDNQLAEALGRLTAAEAGQPASFSGAARAMAASAQSRGVALDGNTIGDASGLSRDTRLPTSSLAAALSIAAVEPELAPVLSGLAVGGFDGTLSDRFTTAPSDEAAGIIRAKTGTLTGISAEAGITETCDGVLVAYAFVADATADTELARDALDDAAAALSTCP